MEVHHEREVDRLSGRFFNSLMYIEKNGSRTFTQLTIKAGTHRQARNHLVLLSLFVTYQVFKNESQFGKI